MSEPMFCVIQDVNDKLGDNTAGQPFIQTGGTIEPTRVERLIILKSKLINKEHGMNYNKTLITDEYHDIVAIPRVITDFRPIISVENLYIWDGTAYIAQIEGRNRNEDEYFIDNENSGFVAFWYTPNSGKDYCKLSYYYGYEEIPVEAVECCTLMIAIDLALSKEFQEECKEQIKKWQDIIAQWLARVEELLNKHIRKKKLGVKTVGKYDTKSVVSDLEAMTG